MSKSVRWLAAALFLLLPGIVSGEETGGLQDTSIAAQEVVITADTRLYGDEQGKPGPAEGVLPALQELEVDCLPLQPGCLALYGGKPWIPVKTAEGRKWIAWDRGVMQGRLDPSERQGTLVHKVQLYDEPDAEQAAGEELGPQPVVITASIAYTPRDAHTASSMVAESGTWYRISTSLGAKWIPNPVIPEEVEQRPYIVPVKLSGTELSYPYPYAADGAGERIGQPWVQPVSVAVLPGEDGPSAWYRYKGADGGERWVSPDPLTQEERNRFLLNGAPVELPTGARAFAGRGEEEGTAQRWLEPGMYPADEVYEGWVKLRTADGSAWVNLNRALLERPEGIVPSEAVITLTPQTRAYRFPLTGEVSHEAGTFRLQQVRALEQWTSPQGDVWYRIESFGGPVWIPEKPLSG
ncbi:hypothetical protein ERY13_23865 [Paenibacillus mucilaginosus]|uniref:hypothetical protein n=1 Tax=Paenibacillus mucilaginosus TaxID=61624 RepID=UPI00240D88D2|nr:hypothetical protein [Paenibacillus mucilaginosus]WFA20054.1 hypothetical protein ERY13_23865 [Paenibacillus mucilaginosus]